MNESNECLCVHMQNTIVVASDAMELGNSIRKENWSWRNAITETICEGAPARTHTLFYTKQFGERKNDEKWRNKKS